VLESFPCLEKVQIQKTWPHKLEVKYSLPVLKVINPISESKFQILTEQKKWLGPVNWSRLPSLPWVRGNWIDRKPELQTKVIELLNRLPQKGTLTPEQISEIQFNDVDGFLVTLTKTGQQIRFGMEGFELKSLRANQVLDYLQSKGLESRVIDLNFSKKVLVRLRNQP
jgi:cell division septal protein FtsQ